MEQKEIRSMKHLYVVVFMASVAAYMVVPSITDVIMAALCPGQDECSLAIFLSGFQLAVTGIGSVVVTPLIGNLSDIYGRKACLTLPLFLTILPVVVLAYRRSKTFFYAYYVLKTIVAVISDGSINCLALAYLGDNVSEGKRGAAFGILAGVSSAAFVCGTLASRFISTAQTFQAAAVAATTSAIYMRIFLKESKWHNDENNNTLKQPILKDDISSSEGNSALHPFKSIPTLHDIKSLLSTSKAFQQVAVIAFLDSLSQGAILATMLYFLKAQFHFGKNQYADLMLILGVACTISQLALMPLLAPIMGEEKLMCIGLFVECTTKFLYSLAWPNWIPYVIAGFSVVTFTNPCIRSIISKQVGPSKQGKAQGCISGISSFANIIAPLLFSPLTAIFLSDKAPFYFPGFSFMCIGFCEVIAFIQGVMIKASPPNSSHKASSSNDTAFVC